MKLFPQDQVMLVTFLMLLSFAVVWLQSNTSQSQRYRLQFQKSSVSSAGDSVQTFKILQLADLHMGEAEDTEWGPMQDVKTFRVLDTVVPLENPDLIVLSGDQLTANDMDLNATSYYYQLCQKLATYKIPWAMAFGNHDDAPLEIHLPNGTIFHTNRTKTSREDLYHVDHSFAPLSLTKLGPSNLFGTSNYILNIHEKNSNKVGMQVLFLDSGGGALDLQIESNQLNWFKEQREKSQNVPLVAFQHIPTLEFTYDGEKCQGMKEDGVSTIEKDPGVVETLDLDGQVHFLAVGHNHGNDYCCSFQQDATTRGNMHVCYGRHSGYGGYGSWDRGARVYEIELFYSDSLPTITWKSWVRMEWGEIQDEYSPYGDDAS
jgi:predicted MPP superfamily phosphohydrolase